MDLGASGELDSLGREPPPVGIGFTYGACAVSAGAATGVASRDADPRACTVGPAGIGGADDGDIGADDGTRDGIGNGAASSAEFTPRV
jgi:hypothetical protein